MAEIIVREPGAMCEVCHQPFKMGEEGRYQGGKEWICVGCDREAGVIKEWRERGRATPTL
jgi:hypothetical protein